MIIQQTMRPPHTLRTDILNYMQQYGIASVQDIRYYTMFKYKGHQIGMEFKKLIEEGKISRNGKEYILNK